LGDGTNLTRNRPVRVTSLTGVVVATGAGDLHSLALMSDGTVRAWGKAETNEQFNMVRYFKRRRAVSLAFLTEAERFLGKAFNPIPRHAADRCN